MQSLLHRRWLAASKSDQGLVRELKDGVEIAKGCETDGEAIDHGW